jgi:DNA-directed RNA polymerase subunit RPC12/RpoP
VMDPGVRCVHCGHLYDHRITHTYPNGNRRRRCGGCGRNFVTMRSHEAIANP